MDCPATTCASPKFCLVPKSTASTLSSAGVSAMTGAHVSLRRIRVGPAPPLLSIASKPAPGKSRSPATVGGAEAQASRPPMGAVDKIFWVFARRFWGAWKQSLVLVNPETVVRWHRAGFRLYWSWISKARKQIGKEETVDGSARADLPDGGGEPNLGRAAIGRPARRE